jgi:uncharacterized protein (DUF2062 family)
MKILRPAYFKQALADLLKTGLSRRQIALGVAVGFFAGAQPYLGFHVISGIVLAYILRLNQVVVFLGLNISNPITFPFILVASAQVGNLILHGTFLELQVHGVDIIKHYIWPLVVGGAVFGAVGGAVLYFGVNEFLRRRGRA